MASKVVVTSPFQAAVAEYEAARKRAALQEVVARFTGRPVSLRSFDEVADQLKVVSRTDLGYRTIPTVAIVGSVGRYNDFTREFLPRMADGASRWARVKLAAAHVQDLPPIEVYQVGDAYFVIDGNHRVSIARQEGVDYLEAYVTEVRTRVPFSPEDSADALIAKTEYAEFLAYTGLDRLRPGADLLVSLPGQYRRLENLIEVHRYFIEEETGRELDWAEAVTDWYDKAYLPVVEAIREQEILRRFPGRTETDLYVWLAVHRAALEHCLDWEMGAETAVARLSHRPDLLPETPRRRASTWFRAILGHIARRRRQDSDLSWVEGRMLDRYSGRLFGDLLLPLHAVQPGKNTLDGALLLAEREQAHLHALHLGEAQETEAIQAVVAEACREAGIRATFSTTYETGDAALVTRAALVDLVLVPRAWLGDSGTAAFMARLGSLGGAGRPLLVGGLPRTGPSRLLLDLSGRADPEAALFVATYLAERWRLPLHLFGDGTGVAQLERVVAYLALHELESNFADDIPAGAGDDSLLIRGVWARPRFRRPRLDPVAAARIRQAAGAVMLCP